MGNQLSRISVRSAVIVLAGILAGAAGLKADAPVYCDRVEQWGVQEPTLRSVRTYNNPFADVSVQGLFRSGDREVVVYGFYDGDSIWRIRFMPESRSSWRFTTVSSDPDLAGKSGSFLVVAPGPGNHGAVVVHNQYHFNYVTPARFPYVQTEQGKFDLDRFDPEFFAHYEEHIRDLQALGIEADIILFHPV